MKKPINWKEIKVNTEQTGFTYKGETLFEKNFIEVIKFHAPGLAPVKDASGAYHISTQGTALYPQRYDRTFGYYHSRAGVVEKGLWFHIDEKGQRVYPQHYQWTGNYQEELCTVRTSAQSYFHIDLQGNPAYEAQFSYAGDYKDGIACVKLKNGLFRHIDTQGQFIHPYAFTDLGIYHKGFATARDEKGWQHIDRKGDALYPQRYLLLEPFYNGQALATRFDLGKEVVDECGAILMTL